MLAARIPARQVITLNPTSFPATARTDRTMLAPYNGIEGAADERRPTALATIVIAPGPAASVEIRKALTRADAIDTSRSIGSSRQRSIGRPRS